MADFITAEDVVKGFTNTINATVWDREYESMIQEMRDLAKANESARKCGHTPGFKYKGKYYFLPEYVNKFKGNAQLMQNIHLSLTTRASQFELRKNNLELEMHSIRQFYSSVLHKCYPNIQMMLDVLPNLLRFTDEPRQYSVEEVFDAICLSDAMRKQYPKILEQIEYQMAIKLLT